MEKIITLCKDGHSNLVHNSSISISKDHLSLLPHDIAIEVLLVSVSDVLDVEAIATTE